MKKVLLIAAAVAFGAASAVAQCTTWLNPSPTTGWTDFTSTFGGAPCSATPPVTNEITTFEVFASEAYQMANILAGGQYRFSTCNGPGAGTWPIRFTIITPTGTVDNFGIDVGSTCAITWTASQSGTYLIVVTQSGATNCATGGPNTAVNNGFPAITYLGGATCPAPVTCDAGNYVGAAQQLVCGPTGTATVSTSGTVVPTGGSRGLLFRRGAGATGGTASGLFSITFAPTTAFPFAFNSDVNGVLSFNNLPALQGSWTVKILVRNSSGAICDSTATGATINFAAVNAPGCVPITICEAGDLVGPATQALCPGQAGTVGTTGQTIPNTPTPGLPVVILRPGTNGTGGLGESFVLTNATFPYAFDNDLNGVLSANSFPPLEGEWIIRAGVSANSADAFGSICDSTAATVVTFLTSAAPGCQPAANDGPCTAEALACGAQVAGSTFGATESLAPILCDGFEADGAIDVWYSFTSDGVTANTFLVSGFDAVLSVYSAGNCNSLGASIACSDDEFTTEETLEAGVLPAGNYFLRVYSFFNADAGGFSLTRTCTCPLGAPGTPCDDGDPNTENDQITFACQCAGTPITTCNVDGGTVATTSPRLNLCVGDGASNLVQLTVSGNVGVGRFGLVTNPGLAVVSVNATGTFNMENFPAGNYFVGHIAVEALSAISGVTNVSQLTGCFDLSNQLTVTSFAVNGGVITANGPTTLCPGSLSFNVTGQTGPNFRWGVLNQTSTTVLANNGTGVFNFATLGPGVYRVVHIAYGPGVNLGTINPQNPQGCLDASNIITVTVQSCPSVGLSGPDNKQVFVAKNIGEKLVSADDKGQLRKNAVQKAGSFDVYPNPSKGEVNAAYNASNDGNVTVRVYDVVGKLVISKTVAVNGGANFLDFDFSELETGMYVINIAEGSKVSTQRIVISK